MDRNENPTIDNRIDPFIKEIIVLENPDEKSHKLPFYADGYPGIMYSETKDGVLLQPINKLLPEFFLYGQTIEPIELHITGAYKLIIFQLYPFSTRLLLDIDPQAINDECYDLKQVPNINTARFISLLRTASVKLRLQIITEYILELVKNSSVNPDHSIKLAVSTIISTKGTLPVKVLREQLFLTERTFERRFTKEIGVTPKQFARIIQFGYSLHQIRESDYTRLTNVAYDNGFTDQSHFIRTFRRYTGKSPKEILSILDNQL